MGCAMSGITGGGCIHDDACHSDQQLTSHEAPNDMQGFRRPTARFMRTKQAASHHLLLPTQHLRYCSSPTRRSAKPNIQEDILSIHDGFRTIKALK